MTNLFYKYQSLKQAADLAAAEVEGCDTVLEAVLNEVVLETIKKYQQKVAVGIEDSASDLLDTFKQKVTSIVFGIADQWRQATQGYKPLLYPRGCRFCHARGNDTILVIEQDPQVRSLLFHKGMMGDAYTYDIAEVRLRLSLPYTIFLLHFRDNALLGLYCGWRNRSLTSLDDLVGKPLLPNIHDNLNVCMSGSYAGNLVEQTNQTLTKFWNSCFSNDLSNTWWEKASLDSRLGTAKLWEENSESDPMFILSVRITGERTLQHMLDVLTTTAETVNESSFRHQLSEEIDGCVTALFNRVTRYFRKTKFEKHYPKEVKDSLREAVRASIQDLVNVVFALEVELRDLSKEIKGPGSVPPVSASFATSWEED